MSSIKAKQGQPLTFTSNNDSYLHSNDISNLPQKYQQKNRNLKPVTHDYRKLLKEKQDSHQEQYVQLQQEQEEEEANQQQNQNATQSENRSPLYNKLQGNQSPLKNVLSNTSYSEHVQMNKTSNNIHDTNFPSIALSPILTEQCSHGNQNPIPNQDMQIINHVQAVLKKKEHSHNNLYSMFVDQKKVVSKLVSKYQNRAKQEEKIMSQKMKELEQMKDNYVQLKRNEELLENLEVQIGIKLRDYKQTQVNMRSDMAHINFINQKNQPQKLLEQSILTPQQPKCLENRCRQAKSVQKVNKQRWADYTQNDSFYNQSTIGSTTKKRPSFYGSVYNKRQSRAQSTFLNNQYDI